MTDWITGNRIQTSAFKSPYIPSGTEFWAQHLAGTPYAGLAVSVLRRGRLDPSPDTYGDDFGEAVAELATASEAVLESKGDVKAGVEPEVKAKPKAEGKRKETKAKPEPEPEPEEEYVEEEDLAFNPLRPIPTELLAAGGMMSMGATGLPPHASPMPSRIMSPSGRGVAQGSLPGMVPEGYTIYNITRRDGTVERRKVPWERGADGRLSSQ